MSDDIRVPRWIVEQCSDYAHDHISEPGRRVAKKLRELLAAPPAAPVCASDNLFNLFDDDEAGLTASEIMAQDAPAAQPTGELVWPQWPHMTFVEGCPKCHGDGVVYRDGFDSGSHYNPCECGKYDPPKYRALDTQTAQPDSAHEEDQFGLVDDELVEACVRHCTAKTTGTTTIDLTQSFASIQGEACAEFWKWFGAIPRSR